MDRLPINVVGVPTAISWRQLAALMNAIEDWKIRTFVEVGVWRGGLGVVLRARTHYDLGFQYVGVDLAPHPYVVENPVVVEELRGCMVYGDALAGETIQQVRTRLDTGTRPAIIFCDNGNKPRELTAYAPLCNVGDYICVHDYPNEVTDKDLFHMQIRTDFEEIDPTVWRMGVGIPMFKRIMPLVDDMQTWYEKEYDHRKWWWQ